MAVKAKVGISGGTWVPGTAKVTSQGSSKNTKYSATSRNGKKKRYRGQGR